MIVYSWEDDILNEHLMEPEQLACWTEYFSLRLPWAMIGVYNTQPRALTIKKNKIKCILLEFPLDLKGKRVNFSQLLPFGIFISCFTPVGAGLRTVEKMPGKSHLCVPMAFHLQAGLRREGHAASARLHLPLQEGVWEPGWDGLLQ